MNQKEKVMDNKKNILWFESETMKGLFNELQTWQLNNQKRFLSTEIQKENGKYCCIALTNPTEVTIVDAEGHNLCAGAGGSMWAEYLRVKIVD